MMVVLYHVPAFFFGFYLGRTTLPQPRSHLQRASKSAPLRSRKKTPCTIKRHHVLARRSLKGGEDPPLAPHHQVARDSSSQGPRRVASPCTPRACRKRCARANGKEAERLTLRNNPYPPVREGRALSILHVGPDAPRCASSRAHCTTDHPRTPPITLTD